MLSKLKGDKSLDLLAVPLNAGNHNKPLNFIKCKNLKENR